MRSEGQVWPAGQGLLDVDLAHLGINGMKSLARSYVPPGAGYFLGIVRYGPMGPCH